MSNKLDIVLTINGRDYAIRVEPRKTLVDAIRDDCGQTGTHIGCEHGVCGACTVILDNEAVRSCLMFALQAQGTKIRTVEGLRTGDELHPLQRAFMAHHALQCGFCTPGFLMLAANALEQRRDISDEEIVDLLASNLCRCTGYQNIIKAVRAARDEMRGSAFAREAHEQSLAAANSPHAKHDQDFVDAVADRRPDFEMAERRLERRRPALTADQARKALGLDD